MGSRPSAPSATPTSPPARVVTIVASDVAPVGGMERVIHAIATRLLRRGWELTIISRTCSIEPQPGLRWVRLLRPDRPHTLSAAADVVSGAWALRRHGRGLIHTNNAVLLNRADVVTAHFCERAYQRRVSISRARKPSIPYRLNSWLASRLAQSLERWSYRPAHVRRVVSVSDGVGREIREEFPAVDGLLQTIPNGVDRAAFARPADGGAAARAELGLPPDVSVAVFVGGDWARKGLRHAVAGVAAAEGWHLLVAGDGDRAAYLAQAQAAGAADRLHFAGRLADPRPAYWAADALVLPTAYEAFSLATLEAAAAGLALILPRINGTEELVEDGINGFFTDNDGDAIAARLRQLAADRDLLARLGAAAHATSARYDWERIVDAYEALYLELLAS